MPRYIGVLPAAGKGLRLGAIPCSKEIMPLGFQLQSSTNTPEWRPVTTLEQHLYAMKHAGAERVIIVINETKDDLIRYVGNGERYGLSIAFVAAPNHIQALGMPGSINLATPWIDEQTTLFAMPDTLVTPVETMAQLVHVHARAHADITLGLFRTTTPQKFGMVERTAQGCIVGFVDKPLHSDLEWMWGIAAWSQRFTHFLRDTVADATINRPEIVLSDIFQAALDAGFRIHGVPFEHSQYRDIGTPQDFQTAIAVTAGHT